MTESIISDWKAGRFRTVYWLQGEEEFFIDQLVDHAEHRILKPEEASFNLTVFYGRDAQWGEVVNACRRYPMFSERQVVLLKEAQQMRDIESLLPYLEQPLASTVFVVAYKNKTVDKRTRFAKVLSEKAEVVTTKKLYDDKLPGWALQYVKSKGFGIDEKALAVLIDHIGNDLSRIVNEVDKVLINMDDRKVITEDDIERYIGISKEFNVFELQNAVANRQLERAVRILNYFEANPKAAPIQQVLPLIHTFFSKVYMLFGVNPAERRSSASLLGVNPYFMKDYLNASAKYEQRGVERVLLLLHHYSLKGVGIGDAGTSDAELMKEMVVKMMAD
jgi:DNA polymerase-3 subunit delta